MKLLLIHASRFEYEVRDKAVEEPEPLGEAPPAGSMENVLVAFCTVEKPDEANPEGAARAGAEAIKEVAEIVKTKNVLVYPYAHLSSSLANKDAALTALRTLHAALRETGYNVARSPFGYYKSFKLHCLGHPLSELSRSIEAPKRPEEPRPIKTEYMILDLDGSLYRPNEYRFKPGEEDFRALVEKEALKIERAGGEPLYLQFCQRFGIEWENYSDLGHMRYGPEAALMFDLISDYSLQLVRSLDIPVFPIKGTNMFDLSVRAVKEHADLFGGRLYRIDVDDKKFVMRYAACHQQFSAVKDWILSYRHLPFGTFEVADSYRLEQSGELQLCFRVRKLHMPDFHIYCKDLEEAKKISMLIHKKIYEEIKKLESDYVSLYHLTPSFFEAGRDYIVELVKFEGKPALLEFVPDNIYYWVLNVEYNIIDELGRPREIGTFQIDVGNAKRFGISYTDADGSLKYPTIIHTALIGSVERYLFTILDRCAKVQRAGGKPTLPLWLSPTQVRLIPVSAEYIGLAEGVAKKLAEPGIRVDIDDRDESVSRKVRDAEVSWIPYILVLGPKEAKHGVLTVRLRKDGSQVEMSMEEFVKEVRREIEGYPFRPLIIPWKVSMRPTYKALG